jgi:hypothetical protein
MKKRRILKNEEVFRKKLIKRNSASRLSRRIKSKLVEAEKVKVLKKSIKKKAVNFDE